MFEEDGVNIDKCDQNMYIVRMAYCTDPDHTSLGFFCAFMSKNI